MRRSALALGPVRLANAALLAPMAGVTDLPFRRIAARYGAGAVVSEMVAATGLIDRATEDALRAAGDGLFPHIVQLAGREAGALADGARLAEAAGADVIDLNMGCPARRVNHRLAGSALMRDLDLACRLIAAVRAAVAVPVTVKMRLGWDDASRNAPELARRAEGEGAMLVTVHARTRCQFYRGEADWRAVAPVVEAVTIPVVVNGDIVDGASARVALSQSGASGVMIGRGAVGRPWLPGRIGAELLSGDSVPPPGLDEIEAVTLELHAAMLAHYPGRVGLMQARKHLAAVMAHHPVPRPDLKHRILISDRPEAVARDLAEWFHLARVEETRKSERNAA